MQRQHGELVPVGEVIADLDGPVKAIRKASPQARSTTGLRWCLRQHNAPRNPP